MLYLTCGQLAVWIIGSIFVRIFSCGSLISYLIAWLSTYLIVSLEVLSTSHMQCLV